MHALLLLLVLTLTVIAQKKPTAAPSKKAPPTTLPPKSSTPSAGALAVSDAADASALDAQGAALSTYCERHSAPEPPLLRALRDETTAVYKEAARMVSGPLQGRILTLLAATSQARRVLELGTFTGYATLCFAEGLGPEGTVHTCDIDPMACDIAQRYFDQSPHGRKITVHRARASEVLAAARKGSDKVRMAMINGCLSCLVTTRVS